jgi:chromosome segregation ATPase
MSAVEENIKRINNKLQNLLKQLNNLQKENSQLHELVKELKTKNEEDQLLMTQLAQQVAILKSAAGQLTEEEKKSFERNINQYLREIDKCIGMLSE